MEQTVTYAATGTGDIVRRLWLDAGVFVAVLRAGTRTPTFVGILSPTCGSSNTGGWLAVGMRRALRDRVVLGEADDYFDAERLLLGHRSGRRSIEPWEPPPRVVRDAATHAGLARRRRAAAGASGRVGVSIGDPATGL